MQPDELLAYLFDGQPHFLREPMTTWLTSSRRFAAFTHAFRDKIRKKLPTTRDEKSLLDLQVELEAAYLLLQERALNVAYEPEQFKRIRNPDFAVTFTTSLTFMLEVTRVQSDIKNIPAETGHHTAASTPGVVPADQSLVARLADAVASKLGQLLPQRANIVLVSIEAAPVAPTDVPSAMLKLQQRAERNDATLLRWYGFPDRAGFFRHYQRLSEVLVRACHLQASSSLMTWINPQARHSLPSKVRTVLYRSLAG